MINLVIFDDIEDAVSEDFGGLCLLPDALQSLCSETVTDGKSSGLRSFGEKIGYFGLRTGGGHIVDIPISHAARGELQSLFLLFVASGAFVCAAELIR